MTTLPANDPHDPLAENLPSRRSFLTLVATGSAAIGAGAIAWPLVASMNPAGDVLATAQTEIDLAPIEPGQGIILLWRGRPVFVRHRTEAEVRLAQETRPEALRDPSPDADRVKAGHEEWLVVSGVCTHLGCIPGGSKSAEPRGEYGGWFCACHGSQYDTAGRIRKGPAPANLPVPPYEFLTESRIRIG
jgi:ubiquinol-cytochrome c reductase iron-sulfur subunit